MSRLIVISIDGFETEDLETVKDFPCFSEILKKASVVKNVREVYPTLTYVIHTSMITGVTPDQHGIYHNTTPYIPDETTNWNVVGYQWKMFSDEIKARTIVDAANEKGLNTACVMWPVMGGKKPLHNLAEIWPNHCGTLRETYEKSCSQSVMDLYFSRYIEPFDWAHCIDTDSYSVDVAADMIRRFQPDLLLEHMISLDYKRHYTGNRNPQVQEALKRIDGFLQKIMDAAKDAGIYDTTNFILLGDHGQMDVRKIFNLNVFLAEDGYITLNENGVAKSWKCYGFSNGYSVMIIVDPKADIQEKQEIYNYLLGLQKQYPEYIERVYTKSEVLQEEHLSGDFEFMMEMREGCVVTNALTGKKITEPGDPSVKTYRSNHGYHPSKGPKPPVIAFGPDIDGGNILNEGNMLDVCPSMARLLDVEMPDLPGHPYPFIKL